MIKQLQALLEEETWYVPALANASALLWQTFDNINWAGFYLMRNGQLVLGPFQGKVACIRIPVGKGVCGTAVEQDQTLVVPDVHQFKGHIACDCASNSEIVIPIHKDGAIVGVLDMDSPIKDRFSKQDQELLELFVKVLEEYVDFQEVIA